MGKDKCIVPPCWCSNASATRNTNKGLDLKYLVVHILLMPNT